jgi:hypothetical protein
MFSLTRISARLAVAAATLLICAAGFGAQIVINETQRPAPVDFGRGPGRPAVWRAHVAPAVPTSGPVAHVQGIFGAPVPWPIEPIHMILLPDGRVLNFGSSTNGEQGAGFVYDIWSPAAGTGSDAHMVLPNTTATNFFCAGQSLLANVGVVAMVGGTAKHGTEKGYTGLGNTTLFTPATNSVAPGPAMLYPRWYATMTALPGGQVLVAGGTGAPSTPQITPELYTLGSGWTALTGAASSTTFGAHFGNWYYPRLIVEPSGHVLDIGYDGGLYDIDPAGSGALATFKAKLLTGDFAFPLALVAPGKVLTLRTGATAQIVDLNGSAPAVSKAAAIDQVRYWSNMTVLPDGAVLVNGGSAVANKLTGVDDTAELWNPATGLWTAGATAAIARLYHSTALLLPDATVITAGGGDPGPVQNLNAEIYYPPYLFNAAGAPASRPTIVSSPATLSVGQTFTVSVAASNSIGAMTLVRAGAATHAANLDQRFFNLPFTGSGPQLTATLPTNPNVLVPGYYMLFVLQNGVPSPASMILITE